MLNLSRVAAAIILTTCFGLMFVPGAVAQSDDGPVHMVPRDKPRPAEVSAESLFPHTKAIRADVNVVLVPVTVTDSMNRPVLGLEKEHFQVYEGEEAQQIRYFSTEDAPISIGAASAMWRSCRSTASIRRPRRSMPASWRPVRSRRRKSMVTRRS